MQTPLPDTLPVAVSWLGIVGGLIQGAIVFIGGMISIQMYRLKIYMLENFATKGELRDMVQTIQSNERLNRKGH